VTAVFHKGQVGNALGPGLYFLHAPSLGV